MDFAKIFKIGKTQVLITLDNSDDEESPHRINQVTQIKGVRATVSFLFKKQSMCNKAFKEYDQEKAEKYHESIAKTLNGK